MQILKEVNVHAIPVISSPSFISDEGDDYGYFVDECFILPFYKKKKSFITYIRFVTGVAGKGTVKEEKDFLNSVITYIKDHKIADMIIAPHTSAVFHAVPDGAKFCEFGSYIIDLTKSEDDLFASLHSKHRNVIRKAEKDGVVISNSKEYKKACKDLVNETAARQYINRISDESYNKMKDNPNIDFWVAIHNEEVVGAAILGWSLYGSYYIYGGSAELTHAGAMNLLHWEAIKKMKQRGVKQYDFVGARINPKPGSKQEGIQRFKSRFGGKFDKGFLWKYSFSPLKITIYTLYVKVLGLLHHSYTKDIIDQENESE